MKKRATGDRWKGRNEKRWRKEGEKEDRMERGKECQI